MRDAALGSQGSSITAEVDGQRLSADLSVHTHADQQVGCASATLPLTPLGCLTTGNTELQISAAWTCSLPAHDSLCMLGKEQA